MLSRIFVAFSEYTIKNRSNKMEDQCEGNSTLKKIEHILNHIENIKKSKRRGEMQSFGNEIIH